MQPAPRQPGHHSTRQHAKFLGSTLSQTSLVHASFCSSCIRSGFENKSINSCQRQSFDSESYKLCGHCALLARHSITALLFFGFHSWGLPSFDHVWKKLAGCISLPFAKPKPEGHYPKTLNLKQSSETRRERKRLHMVSQGTRLCPKALRIVNKKQSRSVGCTSVWST